MAQCPELDVASQGETFEWAVENLSEALELKLEDEPVAMMGGSLHAAVSPETGGAHGRCPVRASA